MIRLAVIGTASVGKSSVARALDLNEDVEVIDSPPLLRPSKRLDADAYLLVCDKDLIDVEYDQLVLIARAHRAAGVALNKADTYSRPQLRQLLQHIRRRLDGIVPAAHVVPCAAEPVRIVLRQDRRGEIVEQSEAAARDVSAVIHLANELVADAANSLRVRARMFAAQIPLAFRPSTK